MKNFNILGLLFILALLFSTQPASAVVSVVQTNQEASVSAMGKKELKKQARFEKMMNKLQKKMNKMGGLIDRNDDTGKWLWWAIVLAIASIIASILFYSSWLVVGLWFLPSILWTAAVICFFIWLLKYLEVI
jgi:hypothetical protein